MLEGQTGEGNCWPPLLKARCSASAIKTSDRKSGLWPKSFNSTTSPVRGAIVPGAGLESGVKDSVMVEVWDKTGNR